MGPRLADCSPETLSRAGGVPEGGGVCAGPEERVVAITTATSNTGNAISQQSERGRSPLRKETRTYLPVLSFAAAAVGDPGAPAADEARLK